ncbi:MAG: ABC transporter ATP-binding protein [Anaerolineaceae bacterium]|nr:ABC transporter ATP-binding protein [Anaerolineaceae bacterium]
MSQVLELRNISKSFGPVQANKEINLDFNKGEIHVLLGENGAGKTTLMNILYGLYQPDEGEILVNGQKINVSSPRDAIHAGVGMVHQHFMLVPVFTVTENVFAGEEELHYGVFLNRKDTAEKIRQISSQHGLEVNPDDYVKDLPVGVQQRVEIIKLLYRNANILILDEPTAVLTPQEIEKLFLVMNSLKEQGKTIIFITHKLKEVMTVADRISVLRAGTIVGTITPAETSEEQLANLMVGREVILKVDRQPAKPGDFVLKVEDIQVLDDRKKLAVENVNFEIRKGEILGIAGVQGNGQSELVEALTGLRHALFGRISINGTETTRANPRTITELGVGHIPEDRQRDGLVLSSPLTINMVLCSYYQPPFAKGIILQENAILEEAEKQIAAFDVRTTGPEAMASALSGGNQQKVIIAREFSRPLELLIASQPTRGLDVGSIEYVHRQIVKKRDHGTAVLLVSTELDEILALSDRISVMYRGKIVCTIDANQATKEKLGLLMAGGHPDDVLKEAAINA